jgi:hypothetical protein
MKKIIIGFSCNSGFFSKAIRFLTNSNISHTYIKIPVPDFNTNIIFHAQGFNVHYINESNFLKKNTVIEEVEVEVSDEQFIEAERVRVEECGKPYSYSEIVGFLWVLLNKKVGRKVENPFYNTSAYICVELVCRGLGIKDKTTLTPGDLRDILISKRDTIK